MSRYHFSVLQRVLALNLPKHGGLIVAAQYRSFAKALSPQSFRVQFTYQAAAAHCCTHPVQHQEDPAAEVAEQSCPQEVEAAARQHR